MEQKFGKEMDRMTPEQEAAARQTRQEKWITLAKDLYNQKEKVEPFQFYPEVRLLIRSVFSANECSHLSN